MGKRNQLREKCGDRNVPGIALDIHSAVCGSGEWYADIQDDVLLAMNIIRHWEPSHEHSKEFDDAVKAMLQAACNEYHRHMKTVLDKSPG